MTLELIISISAIILSVLSLVIHWLSFLRDKGDLSVNAELFWSGVWNEKHEWIVYPFLEIKVVNLGRRKLLITDLDLLWSDNSVFDFPFIPFCFEKNIKFPIELEESDILQFRISPDYFHFIFEYHNNKYLKKFFLKKFQVKTSSNKIYYKKFSKSFWITLLEAKTPRYILEKFNIPFKKSRVEFKKNEKFL